MVVVNRIDFNIFSAGFGDNTWTVEVNGVVQPTPYGFWLNLLICLIFLCFFIFLQRRQLIHLYNNYVLTIDNNIIEKVVANPLKRTSCINIAEISEIKRDYHGNLIIASNAKSRIIVVPREIENREDLEVVLKKTGVPFIAGPYNFYQKHATEIFIATLMLTLINIFAQNKLFVLADSFTLFTVLLISIL